MQKSPIFLSNEQLNALFNQRDSVFDDNKLSFMMRSDQYGKNYQQGSNDNDNSFRSGILNESCSPQKSNWIRTFSGTEEDMENRKTDHNYQMIMLPQDEYYQMKAELVTNEEQLTVLRKEVDNLEGQLVKEKEKNQSLENQLKGRNEEFDQISKKNETLQEQNIRLNQQLKDFMNKNKQLIEDQQITHSDLMKNQLALQDLEKKLSNQQREHKRQIKLYQKEIESKEKDLYTIKNKGEDQRRESSNAMQSFSSIDDQVNVDKIYHSKRAISPQHTLDKQNIQQYKSNIVYGTQSQSFTQMATQQQIRVQKVPSPGASQILLKKAGREFGSPVHNAIKKTQQQVQYGTPKASNNIYN